MSLDEVELLLEYSGMLPLILDVIVDLLLHLGFLEIFDRLDLTPIVVKFGNTWDNFIQEFITGADVLDLQASADQIMS